MSAIPVPTAPASGRLLERLQRSRVAKLLALPLQFWHAGQTVRQQFPGFSPTQKRQAIQHWAQAVLRLLQVSVHSPQALPANHCALVVANHLSWLDILVIQSLLPGVFVAKSEVKRWPLIGPLAQACATIFVDRSSARSARGMVDDGVQALHSGWCVVAFPEGTSSDGSTVGPFHANIFECAVRSGLPVQTLTLRYVDSRTGQSASAAHFTGSMTLLGSLLRITAQSTLCARVQLGAPIAAQGQTRKTLAQQAHAQIRALLLAGSLLGAVVAAPAQAQDVTPPTEKAVQTLNFRDFFQQPPGSQGMHITDTLRRADGQTMALTGYMVQQERPSLGRFMLTPRPVRMSEHADGDADDLPAAWVMVYLDPSQQEFAVPHARGLIEVRGVLSVGRLEESDGRVSWVRLQLAPEATRGMNTFEVTNYVHSLQHTH